MPPDSKDVLELSETIAESPEIAAAPCEFGVGRVFADRYEIRRLLGRGGMGAVYLAYDRAVEAEIALKILESREGVSVERFRQEVRLARRVTHSNVVRTYDLGEAGPYQFLSMEYVNGGNLQTILLDGPLPCEKVVSVTLQICEGLKAAHDAGILHRDLKPENLLLEAATGRIVVTDFGIARLIDVDCAGMETGGVIGTPAYMSPEQLVNQPLDTRSDVYSLGLIVYQLLTGTHPFLKDTVLSTAMARLTESPTCPGDIAVMPDALSALVMQCLDRQPERRPSLEQMMSRLRNADAATFIPSVEVLAPFARLPAEGMRITVTPFRYRGAPESAYLAEILSEELIDIFSMTEGLSVLGTNVEGVQAEISGTVQRSGSGIRISARLRDCARNEQIWSANFDGELEHVFELQDRIAKQVAEALRIELVHGQLRGSVKPEVAEKYLRARYLFSDGDMRKPKKAVSLLEDCLAQAPEFGPAQILLARAYTAMWFLGGDKEIAERSVENMLEKFPELAETHLAAGVFASNCGDFAGAARRLARSLEIAPTCGDAHDYLGRLQLEAGRAEEGLERLNLAIALDSAKGGTALAIAREYALQGDFDRYEEQLRRHDKMEADNSSGRVGTAMRTAMWRHDLAKLRSELARVGDLRGFGYDLLRGLGAAIEDRLSPKAFGDALLQMLEHGSPRLKTLVLQIGCEIMTFREDHALAFDFLQRATDEALVDVSWIDRCPTLDPLRGDGRFIKARTQVVHRARSIWSFD